jgi:hypothetical protein
MTKEQTSPKAKGGNLLGEQFDSYVLDQINQRQSTQGKGYSDLRDSKSLSILNNQTAWVKMASSVSITDELGKDRLSKLGLSRNVSDGLLGSQLAERAILFNTLSSLNTTKGTSVASEASESYIFRKGISSTNSLWNDTTSYGLGGTEFGIQPTPGIQKVDIICLNRGSIREAKISLKAYNKFQFEIIELLYLRLGYHMMLEWGNDKFIDNDSNYSQMDNTIIEDKWFSYSNGSQVEMLNLINQYRSKYSANYDGFFGKVKNFTWSFESDGSYNIEIELITVGDVIESLQVNTSLTQQTPESVTKGVTEQLSDKSPIINSNSKDILHGWLINSISKLDQTTPSSGYFVLSNPKENSTSEDTTEAKNVKIFNNYKFFVTFEELFSKLEELCIPVILGEYEKYGGYKMVEFNKNPEFNLVNINENQISLDPRVCLFKPIISKKYSKFIFYPKYLDPLKDFVIKEKNITYGKLMNLYLNFDFISKCLDQNTTTDGKITLFKFLSNLCNGINKALGGTTKLEPTIRDDRYITIIDQNPIPGLVETAENSISDESKITNIEVYGYNPVNSTSNFVKNINFQTQITPDLASMISIGATAAGSDVKGIDATAFSKWNIGLQDRFTNQIQSPPDIFPELTSEELKNQKLKEFEEIWTQKYYNIDGKRDIQTSGRKFRNELAAIFGDLEKEVYFNDGSVPTGFYSKEEYKYSAWNTYNFKRKTQKDKENLKKNQQTNYISYLASTFGCSDIKIQQSGSAPISIPFTPQESSTYLNFEPENINRGKTTYQYYLDQINKTKYEKSLELKDLKKIEASNQIGFIPVTFDLTLKGISGVKIYQKLNINQTFLPPQYPETLNFLITKVNHSISDNDWTTNLSTLSIPVTNPPKEELLPDPIIEDDGILIEEDEGLLPTPESNLSPRFYWAVDKNNLEIWSSDVIVRQFNVSVQPFFQRFFDGLASEKYNGYTFFIRSLYRTFAEQSALKKQNPKNAAPGESRHNFAAAVDMVVAPPQENGDYANANLINNLGSPEASNWLVKNRKKGLWEQSGIAELASQIGIQWGGNFTSYQDYIHFAWPFSKKEAIAKGLEEYGELSKIKGREIDLLA